MQAFCQSSISKFSTSHPIDSLWTAFKNGCLNVLGSNVSSKMTTEQLPWINRQIKQLTKRKRRAYNTNRYKKTQSAKDYANYKHLKNVVHITCVKRYNEYVNNIIMDENHKPKRLWSFINMQTDWLVWRCTIEERWDSLWRCQNEGKHPEQSVHIRGSFTALTRHGPQPTSCCFRHHYNSGRGTETSMTSQSTQSHLCRLSLT